MITTKYCLIRKIQIDIVSQNRHWDGLRLHHTCCNSNKKMKPSWTLKSIAIPRKKSWPNTKKCAQYLKLCYCQLWEDFTSYLYESDFIKSVSHNIAKHNCLQQTLNYNKYLNKLGFWRLLLVNVLSFLGFRLVFTPGSSSSSSSSSSIYF